MHPGSGPDRTRARVGAVLVHHRLSGLAYEGASRDRAVVLVAFIELWQMLGLKVLLPFSITTHGALLAAAGDREGARVRYEESLALAAETGMRFYDAETMRRIAHLAPDRDQTVLEL